MTAPVIPPEALKVGETDLQVTGELVIIILLMVGFYINLLCMEHVMQKGIFFVPLVTQYRASTS